MPNQFERTAMLLSNTGIRRLASSRVAVFGVGGVGGYCVEALARSGIGHIDIFDHDKVDITNINRQIIALHSTVGLYKVDVMKARILDINPGAEVSANVLFYGPDAHIDLSGYTYIVDAMDTVSAKLELITKAQASGVKIISSMGAGNKLDPSLFEVADIYDTSVCPLARVMRRELKKRGVKELKTVYSREEPVRHEDKSVRVPGSCAFVPAAAGLILAGEVVKFISF